MWETHSAVASCCLPGLSATPRWCGPNLECQGQGERLLQVGRLATLLHVVNQLVHLASVARQKAAGGSACEAGTHVQHLRPTSAKDMRPSAPSSRRVQVGAERPKATSSTAQPRRGSARSHEDCPCPGPRLHLLADARPQLLAILREERGQGSSKQRLGCTRVQVWNLRPLCEFPIHQQPAAWGNDGTQAAGSSCSRSVGGRWAGGAEKAGAHA